MAALVGVELSNTHNDLPIKVCEGFGQEGHYSLHRVSTEFASFTGDSAKLRLVASGKQLMGIA